MNATAACNVYRTAVIVARVSFSLSGGIFGRSKCGESGDLYEAT
jgi:hypothetical protein